jgi:hypothetical protein
MDKKPDQIERDINEYRDQIASRMAGMRRRAQEDADKVRSEAKNRTSGSVEGVKGILNEVKMREIMQDHTVSMVAGAVGIGVLLGVVSEGIGGGSGSSSNDARQTNRSENNRPDSAGGLAGMLSSFISPATSTAQQELEQLVREGFATLKQQVRQDGNDSRSKAEAVAFKDEVQQVPKESRPGAEVAQ